MAKLEIHRQQWAALQGALMLVEKMGLKRPLPGQANLVPEPSADDHFSVRIDWIDPHSSRRFSLKLSVWVREVPLFALVLVDSGSSPSCTFHKEPDGSLEVVMDSREQGRARVALATLRAPKWTRVARPKRTPVASG